MRQNNFSTNLFTKFSTGHIHGHFWIIHKLFHGLFHGGNSVFHGVCPAHFSAPFWSRFWHPFGKRFGTDFSSRSVVLLGFLLVSILDLFGELFWERVRTEIIVNTSKAIPKRFLGTILGPISKNLWVAL